MHHNLNSDKDRIMKKVGIITIHHIYNYGSVLQAFALQHVCEQLGCEAEIINYCFPNSFHNNNKYQASQDTQPSEPKWIKALYAKSLLRQHKSIDTFVSNYQKLSPVLYSTPEELKFAPPIYDAYITGSDQLWSPRHCNGDPAFMLDFAPDNARKISYAASIGAGSIPEELKEQYRRLLYRYDKLSVRESSGVDVIKLIVDKDVTVVLDPTLLLDFNEWNKIASPTRRIKKKYILCYFLNYSFNAFPYVEELADQLQKETGYDVVRVARPPHHLKLSHTHYRIGASPEEFLALVRDAEIVVTTSFHGTVFALNYGKPVLTIVKDRKSGDSRQMDIMRQIGLERQVCSINDVFPVAKDAFYDREKEQDRLVKLRVQSIEYLKNAIYG